MSPPWCCCSALVLDTPEVGAHGAQGPRAGVGVFTVRLSGGRGHGHWAPTGGPSSSGSATKARGHGSVSAACLAPVSPTRYWGWLRKLPSLEHTRKQQIFINKIFFFYTQ